MEMELVMVTVVREDGSDVSFGTSGEEDSEPPNLWGLMSKER